MPIPDHRSRQFTYIDLFAGAGGLSEGFLRANYKPIAHVEVNRDACNTLRTRLAYQYLQANNKLDVYLDYLRGNIERQELYKSIPAEIIASVLNREMSGANLKGIFSEIQQSLKRFGENSVDVVVGGPPCQAYSVAGRSAKKNKEIDDHRNYLYRQYARFLVEFRPVLFIFENVPGLYTANEGTYYKNLKKYFRKLGYLVEDKILDASSFNVVQRRKRVIIVGWRRDLVACPRSLYQLE